MAYIIGGEYTAPVPVNQWANVPIDPGLDPENRPKPAETDQPESSRTLYQPCAEPYTYTTQRRSDGSWTWRVYDEVGDSGSLRQSGSAPKGVDGAEQAVKSAKKYIQSLCPQDIPQGDDDVVDDDDDNGDGDDDDNGDGAEPKYEFVLIGLIAMAVLANAFLGGD